MQEGIQTCKHSKVSWCEIRWIPRGRIGCWQECVHSFLNLQDGNKQCDILCKINFRGKNNPREFSFFFFIQPCDCAGGRLYIWCLRKTRWYEIGFFWQKQRCEERCSSGNLSSLRRLLEAFVSAGRGALGAKSHIYIPIFYTEPHIARLIKDSSSWGKQGRTENRSEGTATQ